MMQVPSPQVRLQMPAFSQSKVQVPVPLHVSEQFSADAHCALQSPSPSQVNATSGPLTSLARQVAPAWHAMSTTLDVPALTVQVELVPQLG
jgi:hypothetical protein